MLGMLRVFLSCDWLSNCLFLQRSHTRSAKPDISPAVVIGFQIVYFYREVTHDPIVEFGDM